MTRGMRRRPTLPEEMIAEGLELLRESRRHRALLSEIARKRRKPPEAGIPVPAIRPRGPLPLEGGAEALLDYSD